MSPLDTPLELATDEERRKHVGEDVEILALRHQITVLAPRDHQYAQSVPKLARSHAARSWPKRPGRPRTVHSIRALVLRLARENPGWGFRRLHGEMLVLEIKVAASTVWRISQEAGIDPAPERGGLRRCVPPDPNSATQWATRSLCMQKHQGKLQTFVPCGHNSLTTVEVT